MAIFLGIGIILSVLLFIYTLYRFLETDIGAWLVASLFSLVFSIFLIGCTGEVISNKPTEYKVERVIHYQADGEEGINKVWLKDEDGNRFYILFSDDQFFTYCCALEDGETVIRISDKELEEEVLINK